MVPELDFSNADRRIFETRLYDLLCRQTQKYLCGSGTSLPAETAGELLKSLVFTLRFALSKTDQSETALLTADLDSLLQQGQGFLQAELTETKRLWERACLSVPQFPCPCLQDSLQGFGSFFALYDLWYFAHQVPCAPEYSIDYPLCIFVPEQPPGVCYVRAWLTRLLAENWLLLRFSPPAVERVLNGVLADYSAYPLNLCEPPLLSALGLAMLRRPFAPLALSAGDCAALTELLRSGRSMGALLDRAAVHIAAELHAPKAVAECLRAIARGAVPRLRAAVKADRLTDFFAVLPAE